MKTAFILLLVIGLAGAGVAGVGYYTKYLAADPPANFRTVTVKRDDLLSTIGATGTLEPEEVVDVGAQVVGRIKDLGIDPSENEEKDRKKTKADPKGAKEDNNEQPAATQPDTAQKDTAQKGPAPKDTDRQRIDYGSIVHEGTELAYIDDAIYKAQVGQAQATLTRANADLVQLKAKLRQTEEEWMRAQKLRPDLAAGAPKVALEFKALSDSDYDMAKANCEMAKASVEVGKAAIEQAEAALELANTNLEYTVIKSPVGGVIVDRRVNVGQTVVASLNAPSLFLIAKDLSRMEVWASVNEADIGRITKGMKVRFTVDAFPGETFEGTVDAVRLNATMTQNVVTYTVVVAFENPESKLLPYLTANVQFQVEKHSNVLVVPNTALRWKPRAQQVAPDVRDALASSLSSKGGGGGGPPSGGPPSGGKPPGDARSPGDMPSAKPAKDRQEPSRLWVQDGNFFRPVEVQTGATDGSQTEVSGDDLKEGMEVVIGEVRTQSGDDTKNPFTPTFPRGTQKKSP